MSCLFDIIYKRVAYKPLSPEHDDSYYYVHAHVLFHFQAPNEESLRKLSDTLTSNNIDHKLWMEQPENIPTCVAAKPSPKDDVQMYFKEFKLFR